MYWGNTHRALPSLVNHQSASGSVWKLDFAPSASLRARPHFLPNGSRISFLQVPENVKAEILEGKNLTFCNVFIIHHQISDWRSRDPM